MIPKNIEYTWKDSSNIEHKKLMILSKKTLHWTNEEGKEKELEIVSFKDAPPQTRRQQFWNAFTHVFSNPQKTNLKEELKLLEQQGDNSNQKGSPMLRVLTGK